MLLKTDSITLERDRFEPKPLDGYGNLPGERPFGNSYLAIGLARCLGPITRIGEQ